MKSTILSKLQSFAKWPTAAAVEAVSDGVVPKTRFLTFANTSFMSTDRIVHQARQFGCFDEISALTERDISDFVATHRDFIDSHPEGYGMWIWKPKIIHDALMQSGDGDVLVYADAGTFINRHGIDRYHDYLRRLEKHDVVTFATSPYYRAEYYVKQDAVMAYCPAFRRKSHRYCYAGLMIIKNNHRSRRLIADWLDLCQHYPYLDRSRSVIHEEPRRYRGNDCDMGLFNLCLFKHRISYTYYPDEVNICVKGGKQFIHTGEPYDRCDWSVLDHVPFQCRRITPGKSVVVK